MPQREPSSRRKRIQEHVQRVLASESPFAKRVQELFARQMCHEAGTNERLDPPSTFVWGRLLWDLCHLFAENYPDHADDDTQLSALMFFTSLPGMLACQKECAPELAAALELFPPQVKGRQELTDWLWQLHNHVNRRTGAPEFTYAEMWARSREQRQAAAALVYYAKREDLEKAHSRINVLDAVKYEWATMSDETLAAVVSVCVVVVGVFIALACLFFG